MWNVARSAPVNADGRVLKHKRAALIGMALHAGLFVVQRAIYHVGSQAHPRSGSKSPVGIVAIGTRDGSFVHPVFEGQGELRSHIPVAAIAEFFLLGGEKMLSRLGMMHGVTTGAAYACVGMRRSLQIRQMKVPRMASQAGL